MIRHYFIPQHENDYKPHLLHPKRTYFYGAFFVTVKVLVVGMILLLPNIAFLSDDTLAIQEREVIKLTNDIRADVGVPLLAEEEKLHSSALARATSMRDDSYFSHIGPEGQSLHVFLKGAGYEYSVAGENLAVGFFDMKKLVQAWENSPTHYDNLIDTEFNDVGIGMRSGIMNGEPVLYVAGHFGSKGSVAVQKVEKPFIDISKSYVSWREQEGGTLFSVSVESLQPVDGMIAQVHGQKILLEEKSGTFEGSMFVDKSPEELFEVIIPPVVRIMKDGSLHHVNIAWKEVRPPVTSLLSKYVYGKDMLVGTGEFVLVLARILYIACFVVFLVTLLLTIFIEIKKQHPHIIGKTALLVLLLATLIVV
ncbi:MAG: CAP domain-containing protein [Candidatus Magasanikbacteria bacterium]